jgi:predicted GIY-YIG superfamily endonuclease
MYYVYVLRSEKDSDKLYIGFTNNLERRINQHNTKPTCSYTKSHQPWKLECYIAVKSKEQAESLERYLKTGSGVAFLNKRLL